MTEPLVVWLGGAILICCLQVAVAVAGAQPSLSQRAGMILGVCGSLAVAGVIAARSSREMAVVDKAERERPAPHEISGVEQAFSQGQNSGGTSYIEGMERWTEAMLELTEHAATTVADDADLASEFASAHEDTLELRDLLRAQADQTLKATAVATLHSICSMWEADQARIEDLAAGVDSEWHRRWRARWVVEGLLRRGVREPEATALPYR
jgi:hypothetical protein